MSRGDHDDEMPRGRYRFGAFTLDLERGFLRRDDTEVQLRPKAFDALAYLVARHGRLVAKAELIAAVWPATSVTDNSLSHCLLEIRRALGDDSQQLIRTVARRGYVFAAPVTAEQESARPDPGRSLPDLHPNPRQADTPVRIRRPGWRATGVLAASALALGGLLFLRPAVPPGSNLTYTELTHLTDSATNPALSPDGRMVAFIRGANTFLDAGQVYVKLLPNGEPVQLTRDDRLKMAPAFSPDGSRIAYTIYTESGAWETWTVPVLGGQPQLMMANAAALTWVQEDQVLFSQILRGMHMTVVTATAARANIRNVYVPPKDRMAHRSAASPDGQWVLVSSEMNASGWLPCRLVPMDGSDPGRIVGPPHIQCSHAMWSPDGRWMYFSAATRAGFRTWRQEFPNGTAAQMSFGVAEEEGLAVWPDGRSLVSSVGVTVSSVWVHDAGTERQITSEGFAHLPSFSRDGSRRRRRPAAPPTATATADLDRPARLERAVRLVGVHPARARSAASRRSRWCRTRSRSRRRRRCRRRAAREMIAFGLRRVHAADLARVEDRASATAHSACRRGSRRTASGRTRPRRSSSVPSPSRSASAGGASTASPCAFSSWAPVYWSTVMPLSVSTGKAGLERARRVPAVDLAVVRARADLLHRVGVDVGDRDAADHRRADDRDLAVGRIAVERVGRSERQRRRRRRCAPGQPGSSLPSWRNAWISPSPLEKMISSVLSPSRSTSALPIESSEVGRTPSTPDLFGQPAWSCGSATLDPHAHAVLAVVAEVVGDAQPQRVEAVGEAGRVPGCAKVRDQARRGERGIGRGAARRCRSRVKLAGSTPAPDLEHPVVARGPARVGVELDRHRRVAPTLRYQSGALMSASGGIVPGADAVAPRCAR